MSRVPCSLRSLFTFAIVKENIMEKRIKIVWILTIVTSILMLGGQAYWLYNQYGYSAEAYMQKLHEQILEAEDKEADIRFQHRQISAEPLRSLGMNLSGWTSLKEDSVKRPEPKSTTTLTFYYRNKEEMDSAALAKLIEEESDSVLVRDTFQIEDVSTELLFSASTLYTLQISNPFQESLLDSLLQEQGIRVANTRRETLDALQWKGNYIPFREGLAYKMKIEDCISLQSIGTGSIGRRSDHSTFTYSSANVMATGGFLVFDTFIDVLLGVSDTYYSDTTKDGRDAEKLCQHHDTRVETSCANFEDVYCLP